MTVVVLIFRLNPHAPHMSSKLVICRRSPTSPSDPCIADLKRDHLVVITTLRSLKTTDDSLNQLQQHTLSIWRHLGLCIWYVQLMVSRVRMANGDFA